MILKLKEDETISDEKNVLKEIKKLVSQTDLIIYEAEQSGYDLDKLKEKIFKVDKTLKSKDKKIREKRW